MAKLIINPDIEAAWEMDLPAGMHTIGSAPDSAVPIEHPSAAAAHCQVRVGDASAHLKDLGSGGGTFVDEIDVQETEIRPGQLIRVGEILLRYELTQRQKLGWFRVRR